MYSTMIFLILILFVGNNLADTGIVTIDVNLHRDMTCSPENIVLLADQPMEMNIISPRGMKIQNANCSNKYNSKVVIASGFEKQNIGGKLTVKNVSPEMGTKWSCKLQVQDNDPTCIFKVRYRNRNEALLLVNSNPVKTKETDLLSDYDALGEYYYEAGETVYVQCKSDSSAPNKYAYCHTILQYLNHEGKHDDSHSKIVKTPCEAAEMKQQLESYNNGYSFICDANNYKTKVTLYLISSNIGYSHNQPTQRPSYEVTSASNTFTTTTTERITIQEISPWIMGTVAFGATCVILLVGYLICTHLSRMIMDKKRRHTEGNYENLSNNSPLPQSNQWEEPIYAEANTTSQSAGCGAQYQNNLDALYTRPIPKIDRPKHINNASNGEYAEVAGGGNEVIVNNEKLNYAQVQFDKDASADRLVTRREDEPQYSEVVQPSVEYGNVFEDGRYVNAYTTSEYAEPAYCGINNPY